MTSGRFYPFQPTHWIVLGLTLVSTVWLVWLLRSAAADSRKVLTKRALAVILLLSTVIDPVAMWARDGWGLVFTDGLPLYLCDWAALVLAYALWTDSSRATEVGFLWGMSGTVHGLITPALQYDFPALDYFGFFAQHGGVPIAGAALVWGMKLYPQRGALWRTVLWSWLYLAVVILFNFLAGKNYGFLSHKPLTASLFDHLGPWPWYLASLQVVGVISYTLWLGVALLGRKLLGDSCDA